jgi:hypothetical protein
MPETALLWDITQRIVVVILTDVSGRYFGPKGSRVLTSENGTDRSSRNVGRKLPLFAA